MIVPYWGEFLVSPAPLELSLGRCSHACSYCFANANAPHRQASYKAMMNLLAEYRQRETFTARLLQWGYPVVMSNRTDPFAEANYRQSLALLEMLAGLGIPVAMQTKGGQGAHEAVEMMPRAVWYVTMTTDDDEVLGRVEPGAPSARERLALIEHLVARGHTVVVGVNPLVPEWLPEPAQLLAELARLGVWGVWIERLHLNYRQIATFKPWQQSSLGEGLMVRARKRYTAPNDLAHIMAARDLASVWNLAVFSVGQPTPSEYWAPWSEVYMPVFPTAQGWVNHCYAQGWERSRLITFEDFAGYFVPQLPEGRMGIDSYLGSVAHNLWWTHKVPPQMTFRELLGIIWTETRSRSCPARMPCFAQAGRYDPEADSWTLYVDERGMPYLVFDPAGFTTYYVDLDLGV
jgi:DNA repair photolyase